MRTLQQIFDVVALHLLTQNAKSLDESGKQCMYRGEAGRKCAAGVLIPDDKYSFNLEAKSVSAAVVRAALGLSEYEIPELLLIQKLQNLHDNSTIEPEEWPERLTELAYEQSLSPSVVTTFTRS